jgi:hypothetical protein
MFMNVTIAYVPNLTMFTGDCCSLTQNNFFILMDFTLTYLRCYVVLPSYFSYDIYECLFQLYQPSWITLYFSNRSKRTVYVVALCY